MSVLHNILVQESSGEISGVGFSDGRTWHEGRKFMLQNINNFVIKVWPSFLLLLIREMGELIHGKEFMHSALLHLLFCKPLTVRVAEILHGRLL